MSGDPHKSGSQPDVPAETSIPLSPDFDAMLPPNLIDQQIVEAMRPTVPLHFPRNDALAVRLLPESQVRALLSLMEDNSWPSTIFSIALGAAVGFVTNAVTATDFKFSSLSAALLSAFCVSAVLSGVQAKRTANRVASQRAHLLEGKNDVG